MKEKPKKIKKLVNLTEFARVRLRQLAIDQGMSDSGWLEHVIRQADLKDGGDNGQG